MKIKLLGKNLEDIRRELPRFGFTETEHDFDLIITHGGDGALLGAEREFPGVPKLPLRDAATAPTCCRHQLPMILADFCDSKLPLTLLPKVAARNKHGVLLAVNDLTLHAVDLSSALRYKVEIDGELYAREILGDGACFSSVHGSTAYYRSITGSIFRVGVGLAFSNSTEAVDHLVLSEKSTVQLTIIRGTGMVIADNDPSTLKVEVGESVEFFLSDQKAAVYGLETFMCHECRKLRHIHD